MKHAHAAEATLPPPPSPLTELQPPVQLVDTRDEKTLLVHDLLLDFDELRGLLGKELYGRRWLDAFLLAAGMDQILEDHLHRDVAELERVSKTLASVGGPLGHVSAAVGRAARAVGFTVRNWSRGERGLIAFQLELDHAVRLLAAASQHADANGTSDPAAEVEGVLDRAPRLPMQLRRTVLRLPTCFRSLDQKPQDLQRIVEDFAQRHPDRKRQLLVVGLRTSGSYLAPLYAHFLIRAGYTDVESMTLRPGQRLLAHESEQLRHVAERDGMVLLTDDPPKTGSSLVRTARSLEGEGVARDSIKLLLPLLANVERVPEGLGVYEAFLLPMERWEIQTLLTPDRLRATLRGILVGRTISVTDDARARQFAVGDVDRVEVLDLGPRSDLKAGSPVRRHVRSLLRVTLRDAQDGHSHEHLIYVKGVGLAFFGDHSIAVAQPLARFLPDLYGVSGGLLFRAWLPDDHRIDGSASHPDLARAIGEYASARNLALPATEDKSLRTAGLNPIWQRIADLLGTSFGRQRVLFRPALHAAARRLLRVSDPSVIDGSMALSQWFAQASDGSEQLIKVDYDERAFSNQDTVIDQLYSYDPVFDLAVAAADHELEVDPEKPDDGFQAQLIRAYESSSGTAIPPERWLLYQVLHLSSHQRFLESVLSEVTSGALPVDGLEALDAGAVCATADRSARAAARIDQLYLARTMLGDTTSPRAGPLCAIDIDGVLETGWLGYSTATPTGVAALRRLMRHGYRPVIASGRSLGEVIDRCRAFGLAGGVAEYGAAIYDHAAGRLVDLIDEGELADMETIRTRLSETPGVHVDTGYRRIVRASRLAGHSRRPLPEELVEELSIDLSIKAVHGLAQTDILPARITKGEGVRALAELLARDGHRTRPPLAFAIGDSFADLSMLEEASAAFAPANADQAVQASGVRITSRSRQAGLAQAISLFLQHEPGACAECRLPAFSADASLLMTAMSAGGAGRWTKLGLGLRFALQAVR